MPNNITNKVVLHGDEEQIQKLLEYVKYDDEEIGSVDFNKIIPMPESLNMTSGSVEHDAINAYLSAVNPDNKGFTQVKKFDKDEFERIVNKINSHYYITKCKTNLEAGEIADVLDRYGEIGDVMSLVKLGERYVDNLQKYGATTWYDFCISTWGSKWNSYEPDDFYDNTLTFQTAWSRVMPIIQKLSEMFPDITMEYRWADEDIGSNVGEADFVAGECTREYIPDSQSKEAYELAFDIQGETAEDFGLQYFEESGTYEYVGFGQEME